MSCSSFAGFIIFFFFFTVLDGTYPQVFENTGTQADGEIGEPIQTIFFFSALSHTVRHLEVDGWGRNSQGRRRTIKRHSTPLLPTTTMRIDGREASKQASKGRGWGNRGEMLDQIRRRRGKIWSFVVRPFVREPPSFAFSIPERANERASARLARIPLMPPVVLPGGVALDFDSPVQFGGQRNAMVAIYHNRWHCLSKHQLRMRRLGLISMFEGGAAGV